MGRIRVIATVEGAGWGAGRRRATRCFTGAKITRVLTVIGALILTVLVAGAFFSLSNSAAQRESLISALHDARHSAEEAGDLLRTTLYSIGDAVISTDAQGKIVMMNAIAEQLTGYAEKEAAGRNIESVFHIVNEQTRADVDNPVRRVLREGKVVGLANHTILISKSGVEFPLDDSGGPIRGRDKTVQGVVLVFRDITARKLADEELARSEQRFRMMADAAPVMIWIAGPDASLEYVNVPWVDFTGRPPESEPAALDQGGDPDDRERCRAQYTGAFASRSPFSMEFRLRTREGEYRSVLCHGVPALRRGRTISRVDRLGARYRGPQTHGREDPPGGQTGEPGRSCRRRGARLQQPAHRNSGQCQPRAGLDPAPSS